MHEDDDLTEFELLVKEKIFSERKLVRYDKKELWTNYSSAKFFLEKSVFPAIAKEEPNLTDHTKIHIMDVQSNALSLIKDSLEKFNTMELYLLLLSILFHDVGNCFGRSNHESKIGKVLNAENMPFIDHDMRMHVIKIAEAHGGSLDKIKKLSTLLHLDSFTINRRELAAIVKFADELAEGPQRTNQFAINNNLIDPESEIFHKYASITKININGSRIVANYNIRLKELKNRDDLKELLSFIFVRLVKLNNERIICAHYTDVIYSFRAIDVCIMLEEPDKEVVFDDSEKQYSTFEINNMDLIQGDGNFLGADEKINFIISKTNFAS